MNETHLFNIVNPYPDNEYSIRFWAGDILNISSDILVVSAFKGSYIPSPGTIFEALYETFDFVIDPNKLEAISRNVKRYNTETLKIPFKNIVIIEMIGTSSLTGRALITTIFNEILQNATVIVGTCSSISFPLIGTGSQGLPTETIAIELLQIAKKFSLTQLKEFNIFAYDLKAVSNINLNINNFLKIESQNLIDNNLFSALVLEFDNLEYSNINAEVKNTIIQFVNLINTPNINLVSIAITGRKVCEQLLMQVTIDLNIKVEPYFTLNNAIHSISPNLLTNKKPYILSYLRLLQSCGNVAAHSVNSNLAVHDVVAISISIIRICQSVSSFALVTAHGE